MDMACLTLKDLVSVRKSKAETDEDRITNDQKENLCLERRKMTPHKTEPTATVLNGRKPSSSELVHLTPIKHPERSYTDPWTPTANLKMLISAASPDMRDREMKKTLFRPIENEENPAEEEEDVELDDSCQFDAVEVGVDDFEKRPSRKQKSLGLLCQKFLALYPDYPDDSESISISLDEVALSLGVERRRIYDIVNVLESLMLVSRVAKNQYVWHGRPRLPQTLQELQQLGREQRYHVQMEQSTPSEQRDGAGTNNPQQSQNSFGSASRRKDKSLRIMSQKFVMLFLVSKTQTVTLDTAAKILIEESQDAASHSNYKTKVRRLYDIANVLTSLALIKKVHVREERGRKPAFKWIGPAEFHGNGEILATGSLPEVLDNARLTFAGGRREKLARHASFHVVPTSVATHRRISSAPSSPCREVTEPVDYSRKGAGNSAVCRLQFEDDTSVQPATEQTSPLPHASGLAPLAVPIHSEVPYATLPVASSFPPHLSTLSQTPVFVLCGGQAPETPSRVAERQKSPVSKENLRKRKNEREETGEMSKRDKRDESGIRETEQREREGDAGMDRACPGHSNGPPRGEAVSRGLRDGEMQGSGPHDIPPLSHYIYVPNTAGLNSLNFLLPAGHSPGSVGLSSGAVPALAVPYVLVPSSAISPYPLIANAIPTVCGEAHSNVNFSSAAMVPSAHFVMGAEAFSVGGTVEPSGPTGGVHSSPEQPRTSGSALPLSPLSAHRQPVSLKQAEPHTPLTPKEAEAAGSKAFFQTPGTLAPESGPSVRRRGSAQRRLDIGHPAAN